MNILNSLLNIGTHITPRDVPFLSVPDYQFPLAQDTLNIPENIESWKQADMFMSAVERQKLLDLELFQIGCYPIQLPKKFLTPLQKTAIAYWRDTTDLEFPGAKPIEVEILRMLRRLERANATA